MLCKLVLEATTRALNHKSGADGELEESSAELLRILKDHEIEYDPLDVSSDQAVRTNVQKYLDWPKYGAENLLGIGS